MTYDIIIAGASFAGLAVAAQLAGKRVLLLDREPVGTAQTSACGTLVSTLRALHLEETILQTHDRLVVHTPARTFVYPVAEPFCTFDYACLCRRLREQGDAEFVQAKVLGLDGDGVRTTCGRFRAALVVDASGWRAALGSCVQPDLALRRWRNFGLETTVLHREDGLHFWYDPHGLLPTGVSWVFPTGASSRVGVGSYQGDTRLGQSLDRFLTVLHVQRNGLHGGYFPHRLRDPIVGNLFLVGDAAGQCLGLTGEGIRPALFFGTHLGRLLRAVVDGEMTLGEAQVAYRALVAARKPGYDLLCLAQRVLPRLPLPLLHGVMAFVNWPAVLRRVLDRYVQAFWLEMPPAGAGEVTSAPGEATRSAEQA